MCISRVLRLIGVAECRDWISTIQPVTLLIISQNYREYMGFAAVYNFGVFEQAGLPLPLADMRPIR